MDVPGAAAAGVPGVEGTGVFGSATGAIGSVTAVLTSATSAIGPATAVLGPASAVLGPAGSFFGSAPPDLVVSARSTVGSRGVRMARTPRAAAA